jgi:phosphatidylglycerol:prolipoprotein diacylglycerol transferase
MNWWQNLPSHINPNVITIGSFSIQWYSMMYLVAFAIVFLLMKYRLKTEKRFDYDNDLVLDVFTWSIIGVIFGGRLGYALFYNFNYYLANPLEIILPFKDGVFVGLAGMSFHGGLIAAVLLSLIILRKRKVNFWKFADFIIPAIPLGYMFGRFGNFINAELYGRVTESPIGMYFYTDSSGLLRHPSQLYEAVLEGLVLFIVLWSIRKKKWTEGKMLGLYLIGYALARIIVEFYREPDAHLGFIFSQLTMGQILSSVMLIIGAWIVFRKQGSE